MRWKQQKRVLIKKRFLFFPLCINDEYRWLETARYSLILLGVYDGGYWTHFEWIDTNETNDEVIKRYEKCPIIL